MPQFWKEALCLIDWLTRIWLLINILYWEVTFLIRKVYFSVWGFQFKLFSLHYGSFMSFFLCTCLQMGAQTVLDQTSHLRMRKSENQSLKGWQHWPANQSISSRPRNIMLTAYFHTVNCFHGVIFFYSWCYGNATYMELNVAISFVFVQSLVVSGKKRYCLWPQCTERKCS